MRLLDRPQAVASPNCGVQLNFRLRMQADGRIIDLPLGKTAIGSGPRCNLRLQVPGVQPIHCLIVHASDRLSVRRWAGETRLNGEPFDESSLSPGDRLSVGPVELEVVTDRPQPMPSRPSAPATSKQNAIDRLTASRDLARSRGRKLLAALRNGRIEQQANAAALEKLSREKQELWERVSVLTGRIDDLANELTTTESARQALEDEKTALADDSERMFEEVLQKEDRCEQLTSQNAALCRDVDDQRRRAEQIYAEMRELADEKAIVSDERDLLREQNEELRTNLQRLADDKVALAGEKTNLADEQAVLCGERDGYRRQCERLQSDVEMLAEEKAVLTERLASFGAERDELLRRCDSLQATVESLAAEKNVIAEEAASRNSDRDGLRQQCEQLESKIEVLAGEKASLADERAAMAGECERLRQEAARLAELERRLGEAEANRESTASELYRALLQLAEMKEHDDHHVALAEAHEALSTELEKSAIEVVQLQRQIEQLQEERATADEARQTLAAQTAEFTESQQRLADENVELTNSLTEARQQLEEAQQELSDFADRLQAAEAWRENAEVAERKQQNLAKVVSRLEGELAAKLETETSSTVSAAEYERQIAEYGQLLADATDALNRLEHQLASAERAKAELEQAQNEWQRERMTTSRQVSDQLQRIAELEELLAEEKATSTSAYEPAPSTVTPAWDSSAAPSVESETSEESEADLWNESAESTALPTTVSDVWVSKFNGESESGDATDAAENVAPFAFGNSIAAADELPSVSGAPQTVVEKSEPTSFIERYSHMFPDDDSASDAPAPTAEPRPAIGMGSLDSNSLGTGNSSASLAPSAGAEDEESIEQYMSKLLQRLRGDTQDEASATQAPPVQSTPSSNPLNQPAPPPVHAMGAFAGMPAPMRESQPLNEPATELEPVAWRTSVLAPQTDLEALRALANETARRAISRHALRKHRRNAVTKMIVSALAGVTSLWLMLESASWLSLQFITGCMSLMVAAYWAGETFRTMLESFRAAYDGPEDDEEMDEFTAQLHAPLPIDLATGLERENPRTGEQQ